MQRNVLPGSHPAIDPYTRSGRLVQCALDTFGRIDAVINNAGILRDRFFFNMRVDEWKSVIDVHLNGSFFVARAAAPHFKAQQAGAYVHMTSTSGLIGNFGQANYGAAKLGVIPKDQTEKLVIVCGVFIHWEAKDDKKIFDYNYEATKLSIARALKNEPSADEVVSKKDKAKHPFAGF